MSENYDDKDIEKLIFGGGLASGEIEPSGKFWNKAYEDILQREGRASRSRISRWKAGFYGMGTIAVLAIAYIIYMHNEVSDIKQQLTTIESSHINTVQQNASQKVITNTSEKSVADNNRVSTNRGQNTQQVNGETSVVTSTTEKNRNTFNTKGTKKTYGRYNNPSSNSISAPAPEVAGRNNQNSLSPVVKVASNANNNAFAMNNSTAITGKESITTPVVKATTNPIEAVSSSQKSNSNSSAVAQAASVQNKKTVIPDKKADSTGIASGLDSVNTLVTPKKPITFATILSKTSISAFYAPGVTDDFLRDKNNDPTNTITANALKTQQDGDGTYAIGLRLAYDVSNKWTIQAGAYYSSYSYNINPTIIHAQQQENGQLGYSITTSSGTVFLPNSLIPTPHLGDSIKVKGSSSRGYISIPLEAKYKFYSGRRLGFYVDGGFCINIAKDQQTQIHWDNTALQEGDLTVQNIYGLNSTEYSYNIGFGASCLIGKGLSIYTEPFVNGAFTSINKNTPVIIYPYFFGLAVGLTYHF